MFRRRPLLRGAMVGGVGYAAGRSAANRGARESDQEQRLANLESQQAAPAAPAPAPADDKIERLKQLGELRDSGVLTPEEFEREKQKVLAS